MCCVLLVLYWILESDFALDSTLTAQRVFLEVLGAVGMLDRGVQLVRLSSRKNMGSYSFQSCDASKFLISNDPNDVLYRKRNWFKFYCETKNQVVNNHKLDDYVAECLQRPHPRYRCFTSRDSSWSLNACMVKKSSIMNQTYSFRLPLTQEDRNKLLAATTKLNYREAYPIYSMSIPDIGVRFCSKKQVSEMFFLQLVYFSEILYSYFANLRMRLKT